MTTRDLEPVAAPPPAGTTPLPPAPGHALTEVEVLRLQVAQLTLDRAQGQVHCLTQALQALIWQTLARYVPAAEVAQYAIDLPTGRIVPLQDGAGATGEGR